MTSTPCTAVGRPTGSVWCLSQALEGGAGSPAPVRLCCWSAPRNTLQSLLSVPSELKEPETCPPHTRSQDLRATLMPFFHSLLRVGSQSSGWPLSPSSIISIPPRVMCESGCCLPGVEVTRMHLSGQLRWGTELP